MYSAERFALSAVISDRRLTFGRWRGKGKTSRGSFGPYKIPEERGNYRDRTAYPKTCHAIGAFSVAAFCDLNNAFDG